MVECWLVSREGGKRFDGERFVRVKSALVIDNRYCVEILNTKGEELERDI